MRIMTSSLPTANPVNHPPESGTSFVTVPLRPRFFQASAYFPMPIVLLATRAPEGATNLAPYSLCFPHLTAAGHAMMLVMRSHSKSAQNLLRTGRVSINFIPDDPLLLDHCRRLAAPIATPDKMATSIFELVPSPLGEPGKDAPDCPPPLVAQAVQVFECKLLSAEAADDGEQRFVLEVEAVRMQRYWAEVLDSGRRGPRLPVDYGFRRAAERWMSGPGVATSGPRLRPSFDVEVPRTPAEVLADFRAALGRPGQRVVGKIRGDVLQIGLPAAELTTWSPSLDLMLIPTPSGTRVHGRIGPQPQVWTTFMFFHMLLGLVGLGGLMWGIAAAAAEGTTWPLWIPVGALCMHAFVAGAAFVGQGLGADQVYRLRSFVDEVLAP
jgi:flavin reductase (DIM6/NTAB) family NADH-FMN oxidoreductase RutF